MLGKTPNKVYNPHLKTGLGYENPECLKKAIEPQPKMYDGEKLKSTKLKVDLPDYEENIKDVEESRLKMKDKMIQLDYAKLNALYESFVPKTEIPIEQTYFSSPSTSNVSSESSSEKSDLPPKKMPNEGSNPESSADNGTEFKNEKLRSYYEKIGIMHHTSIARMPQQNGVVERRNQTLVEAARMMLIFSRLP
ncbi:retrovirus-related pol polyprotein from transposon TNT 1-94 [Tanacetum coccineum]